MRQGEDHRRRQLLMTDTPTSDFFNSFFFFFKPHHLISTGHWISPVDFQVGDSSGAILSTLAREDSFIFCQLKITTGLRISLPCQRPSKYSAVWSSRTEFRFHKRKCSSRAKSGLCHCQAFPICFPADKEHVWEDELQQQLCSTPGLATPALAAWRVFFSHSLWPKERVEITS